MAREIDYDNLSADDRQYLADRPWLPQPDDEIIDEDSYEANTVAELKQLCEERDLETGGKKQDLIDRLVEWDEENGTSDAEA